MGFILDSFFGGDIGRSFEELGYGSLNEAFC
jgi:hypothetical protein